MTTHQHMASMHWSRRTQQPQRGLFVNIYVLTRPLWFLSAYLPPQQGRLHDHKDKQGQSSASHVAILHTTQHAWNTIDQCRLIRLATVISYCSGMFANSLQTEYRHTNYASWPGLGALHYRLTPVLSRSSHKIGIARATSDQRALQCILGQYTEIN